MYPEDRVLIAYVPRPADFDIIRQEGWYRIPQRHAPKGLYAEYIAFYFGRRFGSQKWAIHYYAPRLGHELLHRRTLLPHQPDHPRADDLYYKIQLGPLQTLSRPILSLRWRRITFVHTTWDRFQDATEINDLFVDGEPYVDRLYAALKERGVRAERNYELKEAGQTYRVPLLIVCKNGRIPIRRADIPQTDAGVARYADSLATAVAAKGGVADDSA